ncbi:MAG: helix-turn-helix transcriptional regulator [Novosphingobium sp.]|uniref:helix-turn-helix domain-containing protein n=1 Tax=Novosphingobium sp. TaxID=1874826 RepID=UPI0027368400|nr:helix-turn-helix transcriptional regulator [Novosphingobium sp.]MDP3551921.1 helix-turn-helix transcriptional regulator [Novosphingobium sp.]
MRIVTPLLANQAGISLSTLEKALAGKRNFILATLVRIESALGLTAANLAGFNAACVWDFGDDWMTASYLQICARP